MPPYLLPYVYEVVNGKAIFYKGYKEAILLPNQPQEMGVSSLQSRIITLLILLLGKNDIEENYGWFIVSTIYFETKLTDEIMLWKYNESENKWYEKTINTRLLLQLNGT